MCKNINMEDIQKETDRINSICDSLKQCIFQFYNFESEVKNIRINTFDLIPYWNIYIHIEGRIYIYATCLYKSILEEEEITYTIIKSLDEYIKRDFNL